jgi:hypothetical protein
MAEIVVLLLRHTSRGYDAVASNGAPTDVGCPVAVTVSNVGEHEHNHSSTNQAASRNQLVSTPTLWKWQLLSPAVSAASLTASSPHTFVGD